MRRCAGKGPPIAGILALVVVIAGGYLLWKRLGPRGPQDVAAIQAFVEQALAAEIKESPFFEGVNRDGTPRSMQARVTEVTIDKAAAGANSLPFQATLMGLAPIKDGVIGKVTGVYDKHQGALTANLECDNGETRKLFIPYQ